MSNNVNGISHRSINDEDKKYPPGTLVLIFVV